MEEMHVLLKNRGKINPRSSQEYADRGGFAEKGTFDGR